MPTFEYRAKVSPKQIVTGIIVADNDQQAIDKILQLGQTPLEVKIKSTAQVSSSINPTAQETIVVPRTVVAIFTRQMADMVDAGIPLLRCLEILLNQQQHPKLMQVLTSMHLFVKDGGSFSGALSQHPRTFSLLYCNIVKSGELAGALPQVLNRMADLIEKDLQARNQIKSSLLYPAIILVVGFVTMFVLLSFVMPKLIMMFDDFDTALPLPTQIVIAISSFLASYWWLIGGLIVIIVYYVSRWLQTSQGRLFVEELMFKIPVLTSFIKEVEIARFARTMGTLLESGVTISAALDSVVGLIENTMFRNQMVAISKKVQQGERLTTALKKCSFFSETAINLISIGEESGKLEKGLYKLAQIQERAALLKAQNFTTILGPAILVCVVFVIGAVIISILLPMFRINMIIN